LLIRLRCALALALALGSVTGCEGHLGDDEGPLITTDDLRPHGDRGACTGCHIVSRGPGALARSAPLIGAHQARPHPDRGACTGCHAVTGL